MARSRLCARPDCSTVAEVALRYDYQERTVWLDDLGGAEVGVDAWGMCANHANGLKVPHGWSTEDRRAGHGGRPVPTRLHPSEPAPSDPDNRSVAPPLAV